MKKSTVIGLLAVGALPFFLVAPGKIPAGADAFFRGRRFAHRGLYEKDQSVAENSLEAFRRAVDAGYGIELDVQLSKDGRVVVFHDDDLDRVCGVNTRVDALPLARLRQLRLFETDARIPLFTEVLALVSGRVPLLVELKTGPRRKELCEKTLALLEAYSGDVCVESFDPRIVSWFRFHAPDMLRGQLAQPPRRYVNDNHMSPAAGFVLGNTLLNAAARPHFIAYLRGKRPLPVRVAESLGAMRAEWTPRSPEEEDTGSDAVIFEYYRPETVFQKEG